MSKLTPADFCGRFVHPETGLEYEDFAAFFQGKPALRNFRNTIIKERREARAPEKTIRAYWQAWDAAQKELGYEGPYPVYPLSTLSYGSRPERDAYNDFIHHCHHAGDHASREAGY